MNQKNFDLAWSFIEKIEANDKENEETALEDRTFEPPSQEHTIDLSIDSRKEVSYQASRNPLRTVKPDPTC